LIPKSKIESLPFAATRIEHSRIENRFVKQEIENIHVLLLHNSLRNASISKVFIFLILMNK